AVRGACVEGVAGHRGAGGQVVAGCGGCDDGVSGRGRGDGGACAECCVDAWGEDAGSGQAVIKPEEIPQFTGDLEQLEKDYDGLKKDAGQVRATGADVHDQFQKLRGFYQAPEAEKLFGSTKPVAEGSDTFGTHLETVSSALSGYASEIRPLVAKLKRLKT